LTRHPYYDPLRHKITLLEATEIAGGASGKAGGLLALWAYPSSIVPLSYQLHAELAKEHGGTERWGYREVECGQIAARGRALGGHKDLAIEKGHGQSISLQKRGSIDVGNSGPAGLPADLDWFVPNGLISYESMSRRGETAQVHPYLFTTSIAKLAEENGAKIVIGAVTDIGRSAGGVQSVTYNLAKDTGESNTIPATDVVISTGPWTKTIFPKAPISAVRAHSAVIRPMRQVSAYALFTNIQLPGAGRSSRLSRLTTVTPEIYARPDNTVYTCGEGDRVVPLPRTTANVEVDESRCQDIIDSVGSISNELRDGEVLARQACYLPSVDSVHEGPLIGHTDIKGLYMAAGHTCWGIQNAPGTGKLISEFVFEGEARSATILALDPRKFL
jgi:glycine/D-amino acid oxidase-like deaminating enzyme